MPHSRTIVISVVFMFAALAWPTALRAQWTPEEMMKVRPVGSVLPSPDGKRVLFTVTEPVMTEDKSEYLTQVWLAAADGGGAVQFTFGDKSSTNPRWSPCGKWIAFASSRSGKANIWLIRADGGEAERLTDVKSGVGSFAWAPDGRSIAFAMPDPASDQDEKDQKARKDARVVGEGYKMSHPGRQGRGREARGAPADRGSIHGQRLGLVARREDDPLRPSADAGRRRLDPVRHLGRRRGRGRGQAVRRDRRRRI